MITTDMAVLRAPNEPATIEESKDIIAALERELAASRIPGVGLAAPQIGIHKRVAIVRTEDKSVDLVNPVILEKERLFLYKGESCLSLPEVSVDTWRYLEVFVKDDFHPAGFIGEGFVSVVLQHEIDHLDSVLIMDRAAGKKKIGRNDPCPCGALKDDGKPVKFKKCHGRNS